MNRIATKKPCLTIGEAAKIAGFGINRFGRAVRNGVIPSVVIGKRRVIIRAKLEEFLSGRVEA